MKKILFSGMMCATFIVSGFLVSQEKVEAGGYVCSTKGWVAVSGSASCSEAGCTATADSLFTDNPNVEPGETVTIADVDENGECIPTETGDDEDDDSDNNEREGTFRVKIKTYDCNGNEESTKIQGSKVKLYEKDGDKEDEDKTNFKGEANFYDVEEGKYYVKCEVSGYVSLKDQSKNYYKSGTEKVKDGERAHETCHLIKESCDTNSASKVKLAQTGGSIFDLILNFMGSIF